MFGELFGVGAIGDVGLKDDDAGGILSQNGFIDDILSRRNKSTVGGDTVWFLELNGATVISPTPFEPDPNTYRQEYYYNSLENIMYKRAKSATQNYVWVRMR